MAALRHRGCPQRNRPCWDEAACVTHYGMMSLHEVFETVGSQLTETEIELLSFLLNELCPSAHPLDPAGWTVDYHKEDSESTAVSPSPQLLKAWRHLKPRASQLPFVAPFQPKSGLELLLELERRGYLSDGNLEPLLQLLRVLTRHDLLPLVSHKKRRTGEGDPGHAKGYHWLSVCVCVRCQTSPQSRPNWAVCSPQCLQRGLEGGVDQTAEGGGMPLVGDRLNFLCHFTHSSWEAVSQCCSLTKCSGSDGSTDVMVPVFDLLQIYVKYMVLLPRTGLSFILSPNRGLVFMVILFWFLICQ